MEPFEEGGDDIPVAGGDPTVGVNAAQPQEQPKKSALGIEDLPEDALLHIFSRINDSFTLQVVLPRVSPRWKAVAEKARGWHGIVRAVKTTKLLMELSHHRARPLVDGCSYFNDFLWPTERRVIPNHRVVRDYGRFLVHQNLFMMEDGKRRSLRQGYLESVWRSRHHLKRLALVLDDTTKTDKGMSSLYVVSQMFRLEELYLFVENGFEYKIGTLQRAFPNLKSIEVNQKERSSRQNDLIKDLLVVSLVQAHFRPGFPYRADLLTALAKCQNLTDLTISSEYAPAFRALFALKCANVHVILDTSTPADEIVPIFVSLYSQTLRYLHVTVWCQMCPGCIKAIRDKCDKGVESMRELGFRGKATYILQQKSRLEVDLTGAGTFTRRVSFI
ncbi:uncharacterized protein LOC117652956 [Thrips palmi]|uniref:Uncharacterized protein LOC117652956 n=1 Tax=Thrips palmi TaxID=161013 RepID=A0A6P9A815_THRPL|nr:uncharacterized protein LOC117652956 [Thrips palmi]XP_034254097.1 uncharacterized protein LOC117652956 [Thrips palmi]